MIYPGPILSTDIFMDCSTDNVTDMRFETHCLVQPIKMLCILSQFVSDVRKWRRIDISQPLLILLFN